jgi:hypothetical protein
MDGLVQGHVFRWWSSSSDGISIWVMFLLISSISGTFPALMKYGACSSSTSFTLAQGTIGER